jgi:hypothetical protein
VQHFTLWIVLEFAEMLSAFLFLYGRNDMDKTPDCVEVLNKVRVYGIKGLIAYLHKRLKKQFAVIDGAGTTLYASSSFLKKKDISFILQQEQDQGYYGEQKMFIYRAEKSGTRIFLAVYPVLKADMPDIALLAEDLYLALAFYLAMRLEIKDGCVKIENHLMEMILGDKRKQVEDVLPFGNFNLNTDKPYVIQLFQVENTDDPAIINEVIEQVVEYTTKNKLPALRPISWRGQLVHIIPALYQGETFELSRDWPEPRVSEVFRKELEQNCNIKVSIGMGQIYSLHDLYKSYNEARIALTFRRVAGEIGFVQRFCDLGFFQYIFLQDIEVNRIYVMDRLGPIINYDNQKNGQLLSTLRILIDNGFNWKETAAHCSVHVNTIYYRVERIEKLLMIKLDNMESKFTLYVALKLWDILNALEKIDDYYIGSIGKIAALDDTGVSN